MDQQPSVVPNSVSAPPTGASVVGDWPARATDLIESLVALLRDKTVRPLTLVARVVVFGIIVLAAASGIAVFVSIGVIRLLTVDAFNGRVWASDLLVGAIFVIIGMVAWSQRTVRHAKATK